MSNGLRKAAIGVAAVAVLTVACGSKDAAAPSAGGSSTASIATSAPSPPAPSTASSGSPLTAPTGTEKGSASVSSTPNSTAFPLQGTTWQLVSTSTGTADPEMVDPAIDATLTISDTQLHASTGCNSGSGSITMMGESFHVDPLATTRMACTPDRTELEATQLAVLTDRVSYAIDGDQLTLTNGAGTLVYQAASDAVTSSSEGEVRPATPVTTVTRSAPLSVEVSPPTKSRIQVSIPENPNSSTS